MLKCAICSTEITNEVHVVVNQCGHHCHQHCLQTSLVSSGNCPQCRSINPEYPKIVLELDEATQQLQELRACLKEKTQQFSSTIEFHLVELRNMQNKLECNEKVCLGLQEKMELVRAKHDSMEQQNILRATEIHDLEVQLVHKTTENEGLIIKLKERDAEIELKNEEINNLRSQIRILQDFGNARMQALTEECRVTTEKFAEAEKECTELTQQLMSEFEEKRMLFERNGALEEKLKQIQIHHSIEPTVSKMRFESMMERPTGSSSVIATIHDDFNELGTNKDAKKEVAEEREVMRSISNGVAIKGFSGNFSPRATVLKLAHQMQLRVEDDDIVDVVLDRDSNHTFLNVRFKTSGLKDLFLAHADQLKSFPETQDFEIRALSADNDLLAYAQKLKAVGYKKLYTRNNIVFASVGKKSTSVKILNKAAVDKMMELSTISGKKHQLAQKPHKNPAQPLTPATHQMVEGSNTSVESRINSQWQAPFRVVRAYPIPQAMDARSATLVAAEEANAIFSAQNRKLYLSSELQRNHPNVEMAAKSNNRTSRFLRSLVPVISTNLILLLSEVVRQLVLKCYICS